SSDLPSTSSASSWIPWPCSVLLLGHCKVRRAGGGSAVPGVGLVAAAVGRDAVEGRGGPRAGDRHAARQREAGQRRRAGAVGAAGVRVVVHEGWLFGRRRLADVRLRPGVLAAGAVGSELGERDRGGNT